MLRHRVFGGAFRAIHHSGAARMFQGVWGGVGAIFCLHHVVPGGGEQHGFAPNSNLEITPEFLEQLIKLVRDKGYDLVSLDEACWRLKTKHTARRFAIFTLDDGYKDNLCHGMPVFKKHNCPFTVYVTPRIAEGTCELWWRGLELLIEKSQSMNVQLANLTFNADTTTEKEKWAAWRKLAPRLQALPEYEQREWIVRHCESVNIDLANYCRSVAMSWDEINQMARDPLATVGAHTLNHYNLLKLSAEDAKREIVQSGRIVQEQLARPIKHFAYPYGNVDAAGPREFGLAKAAGYETAVVTRLGTVLPSHADHMMALPRLMISGRYQDVRHIDALLSGVPSRITNRFSGLNVD